MSLRSPFLNNTTDSGNTRQSPFRRQNSVSPAATSPSTVRTSTPTASSPTKSFTSSPSKNGSLSPEKTSPFVRRPSQNNRERPSSPFARPASQLSLPPQTPSRNASASSAVSYGGGLGSPLKNATIEDEWEEDKENDQRTARPTPEAGRRSLEDDIAPAMAAPPSPTPTSFRDQLRPVGVASERQRSISPVRTPVATASKPPAFSLSKAVPTHQAPRPAASAGFGGPIGGGAGASYTHLPPALLRSMRESFEVLDSNNSGQISSASLLPLLEQLSLPTDAAHLSAFFPPHASHSVQPLNLARYLDLLSGPLANLSRPEELEAAFSAFDKDDSGQIDVDELREAMMRTAPEPGEEDWRLGGAEVETVMREFTGRRVWGGRRGFGGGMGKGSGGGSGGEVFRYRDFMASVSGGGAMDQAQGQSAAVGGHA
ncbi:EF-hand [Polychaeton citri CBS 116435]|uniref:EF-hand n=1 Tax=Polychaeton citri CBS 116435 TaxID=1314669 RepID=A0A9P4ULT0_9PEZI|nr:EF-hand [Polychaeton citri CBS 116435]